MLFDIWYWVVIGVGMLLSLAASAYTKSAFGRAQKIGLRAGLTGAEVAQRILDAEGITDVTIQRHEGFLSDHYNPMSKTLALSPDVYAGRDCAAAGVAAHEVGHAIQHARGYSLMWFRSILVPAANIGSGIGPWLIIIGLMLGAGAGLGYQMAVAGVILFGAATAFTLVTVPVEFDASARAKERLATIGITSGREEDGAVAKVLTAAGLTYVAAAVSSILQLLYWAYQAGLIGGNRDD